MEKVRCENEYCIFQEQGKCIKNSITLDYMGICISCKIISLTDNELSKKKKSLLKKYEKRV